MSLIDPRAIIDPSARLAADVQVGPWSIVGAEVEIGEGTVIGPHVVLKGPTKIGKHNRIYQFSSVGEDTPDLKYKGEPTRLVIGDHNVIREGVTIHRGTVQDRAETTIGDHNLIMAYAHIGHDSVIGNHCILVNNTALAGHVHVDDWAILSGYTLVHQYCRIGAHSFSGMGSAIGKDVPAYVTVRQPGRSPQHELRRHASARLQQRGHPCPAACLQGGLSPGTYRRGSPGRAGRKRCPVPRGRGVP